MPSETQSSRIDLVGIRITADGLMPDDGNLATLVRRVDIRNVELHYGFRSAHPLLQLIFGVALATVGSFVGINCLMLAIEQDTMIRAGLLMLVPALLGLITLIDAGRRGHFLKLVKQRGTTKLTLHSKATVVEIRQLCDALRSAGYLVTVVAMTV